MVQKSRGMALGSSEEEHITDPMHVHTSASSRDVSSQTLLKSQPHAWVVMFQAEGLAQVLLPPLLPVCGRALGFCTSVSPPCN